MKRIHHVSVAASAAFKAPSTSHAPLLRPEVQPAEALHIGNVEGALGTGAAAMAGSSTRAPAQVQSPLGASVALQHIAMPSTDSQDPVRAQPSVPGTRFL